MHGSSSVSRLSVADVVACVGEPFGRRRGWLRAAEQVLQIGAALLEVDEFGDQFADPCAALGLG